MKIRDGFYSFVKIVHIEFFIGAVQVIAIQPKAHKHDFNTEFFFK